MDHPGQTQLESSQSPDKVLAEKELLAYLGSGEMTKEQRKSKDGKFRKCGWLKKNKRLAIYLRDSFTCAFCGVDMRGMDARLITVDHLTPRAKKGTNKPENLTTACLRCNCQKQDKSLPSFAGAEKARAIRKAARVDFKPFRDQANAILKGLGGYADESSQGD
jgi:hypothetical protein